MFKKSFYLITVILLSFSAIFAQEETEPAKVSAITQTKIPGGAVRVLPSSVPAEINQGLEKMIEAGEGKIIQGEREVLAWMDGSYKKADAANIVRQLENNLRAEGWLYEVGGTEGTVTFFSVLKENPKKRAVLGYFVAEDEALVVAWTEVLPADAGSLTDDETPGVPVKTATDNSAKNGGSLSDLLGKWERKQGGVSSVDANTGKYLGSSGNYESYEFFADGRVAYVSLIAVQNYGCRMEVFSSRKGRASISSGNLNVNLTSGSVSRDDSCSKSKNYTKPMDASSETYRWKIEQDEYGTIQLALTESNGETYYYRRSK